MVILFPNRLFASLCVVYLSPILQYHQSVGIFCGFNSNFVFFPFRSLMAFSEYYEMALFPVIFLPDFAVALSTDKRVQTERVFCAWTRNGSCHSTFSMGTSTIWREYSNIVKYGRLLWKYKERRQSIHKIDSACHVKGWVTKSKSKMSFLSVFIEETKINEKIPWNAAFF